MSKRGSGLSMSFLDVLCSAMGGMIVLAVIFSVIKNPSAMPKSREFILVELLCKKDHDMGLEITAPNGMEYAILRNDASDRLQGMSTGMTCRGGLSDAKAATLYLEIREPAVGKWLICPYFADWAIGGVEAAEIESFRIWTTEGLLAPLQKPAVGQPSARVLHATGHLESSGRLEIRIAR